MSERDTEDEYSENEEDDEDEPILKYSQLSSPVIASLLKTDNLSAIAASDHVSGFILLGTQAGVLHILDARNGAHIKSTRPHSATITALSVEGGWVGSSSIDGRIILQQLPPPPDSEQDPTLEDKELGPVGVDFKRPMLSVSVSPTAAPTHVPPFIAGGLKGELSMHTPSNFPSLAALTFGLASGSGSAGYSKQIVHAGEGPIWATKWSPSGGLVAWANDKGTKIYSTHMQTRISYIDRGTNKSSNNGDEEEIRAELVKPTLVWLPPTSPPPPNPNTNIGPHLQDLNYVLIVAWASTIKFARIISRSANGAATNGARTLPPLGVEITRILEVEGIICGLVPFPFHPQPQHHPHPHAHGPAHDHHHDEKKDPQQEPVYLVLTSEPQTPSKAAPPSSPGAASITSPGISNPNAPEVKLISQSGVELSSDILSLPPPLTPSKRVQVYSYADYKLALLPTLAPPPSSTRANGHSRSASTSSNAPPPPASLFRPRIVLLTPHTMTMITTPSIDDRVQWLVERELFPDALNTIRAAREDEIEEELGDEVGKKRALLRKTGKKYLDSLFDKGEFEKAAIVASEVLVLSPPFHPHERIRTKKDWEELIFRFASARQLGAIVEHIPLRDPQLGKVVYELVLGWGVSNDVELLMRKLDEWEGVQLTASRLIRRRRQERTVTDFNEEEEEDDEDGDLYDVSAVIGGVKAGLEERVMKRRSGGKEQEAKSKRDEKFLREALVFLYKQNHQPSLALPHLLYLGDKTVIEFVEHGKLWTSLVDIEVEIEPDDSVKGGKQWKESGVLRLVRLFEDDGVELLVKGVESIPVAKVVPKLASEKKWLFLYLDGLARKDLGLVGEFANEMVSLYATYSPTRLLGFLRASNMYNPEKAYQICDQHNLVPEMVFLLALMGDNKKALRMIIERVGDVKMAIDFVKEQIYDPSLWSDLLTYSEDRPTFIRALLENVGSGSANIDPITLIRRIKNGMEIPGLKDALIKVLRDMNVQTSLLEGCRSVLDGDCRALSGRLVKALVGGTVVGPRSKCDFCHEKLHQSARSLNLLFLCGHKVHFEHVDIANPEDLPRRPDLVMTEMLGLGKRDAMEKYVDDKIAFSTVVRSKMTRGCPVCHIQSEGVRT